MVTLQELHAALRNAMARERHTWERRRRAFSAQAMDEMDAADAEWLSAAAEVEACLAQMTW